ncbi:MAG: peptidase S41 [Chitinophagaceae bacterium]|nr:MAG: peptidase S41 [Chitinophagaceae bacterium]
MRRRWTIFLPVLFLMAACGTNKHAWSPAKKYSPETLGKDYAIYRQILEEAHPGLYWYTSKDSMDRYFEWGAAQLTDSMDEPAFRKVLMYVTSKINCGHTSVRYSDRYSNYLDTVRRGRLFPLSLKVWDQNAVIAQNLHRQDSVLTRGTIIRAINGRPMRTIIDSLFNFIPTDGYNTTHKYQALSNRGYFGSLYSSIYGFDRLYEIDYTDTLGNHKKTWLKPYYPGLDSTERASISQRPREPKPSRRERRNMRRNAVRLLKIDTAGHVAMMDLNSFSRGFGLRSFFRRSFRTMRKHDIRYLVIDVRGNGGGSVTNSTLLTKYLADHSFKVGDSLYAVTKRKKYGRYIQHDFSNRIFMSFFAFRKKDGLYHFTYFEKHKFDPRRKNHFDGKAYILTGGNSFSATTLFAGTVREQENVVIVGEETGGGAYGNNAWLIPDVRLPGTGVGFRLPLFRLVINKNNPKTGKGVQPEVFSGPTPEAIRHGKDYKLDDVLELIKKDKEAAKVTGNQVLSTDR